jgi:hypothetical protein
MARSVVGQIVPVQHFPCVQYLLYVCRANSVYFAFVHDPRYTAYPNYGHVEYALLSSRMDKPHILVVGAQRCLRRRSIERRV